MALDAISMHSLLSSAVGFFTQLPLFTPFESGEAEISFNKHPSHVPSCPIDGPLSCHNFTAAPDNCCFIYPGGQLLSTQFWDAEPPIGPADSWTLHGLWPDHCDGSYPTYCNQAPHYKNITGILQEAGENELLSFMNEYWLPDRGSAEHFWEHEWNKHGTCVNTIAPACYGKEYEVGTEVVDFFTRAVDIFKDLDTFTALALVGILPSRTITYTQAEIQEPLKAVTGAEVILGCRRGKLNQVWYSFNVKGSLQTGEFVAATPVGKSGRGSCPRRGIRYLPKGHRDIT